MQLQTIPRVSVCTALRAARLPLSAAERLTGRAEDDSWPPTLAFDALEANVKQVVGALVRDDELSQQGRLEAARVSELREAVRLATVADQTRIDADTAFESRRDRAEDRRDRAAAKTKQRETAAERQRRAAKAKADAQARERTEQARERRAERDEALAEKARATRVESIAKERKAVRTAKAAAATKAEALATDDKIRASKASRSRS